MSGDRAHYVVPHTVRDVPYVAMFSAFIVERKAKYHSFCSARLVERLIIAKCHGMDVIYVSSGLR